MYLKSIEVQGFKSFANKIVFDFHNGITGIVGPNGSGKSNVADAVRWVLGEQSAKQLRGASMQDVIFAGTENRKPLGYAYVAITLDNSDHSLAIDFNEVTVARRVYRSGESEYLINGNPCRLKEVSELFYDTGIGKEGYSIIDQDRNMNDFRYPVQYVLRPNLDFRGFCGKIASGVIHKGDEVVALPSMKHSHVKSIVTYEGELDMAFCPQCVTLTLEDEIDISRGEMLVKPDNVPHIGRNFETMLVWMDEEPMDRKKQFFLKHNTNTTRATLTHVNYKVDVNTMQHLEGSDFKLNEIGQVQITTAKTLFFDPYSKNKATGAFILIDPITNNTSAVGMICNPLEEEEINQGSDIPVLDLPKLGIAPEHYEAVEKAVKDLSRQGLEIKIVKE